MHSKIEIGTAVAGSYSSAACDVISQTSMLTRRFAIYNTLGVGITSKKSGDVTVAITGIAMKAEVGRVGAIGNSKFGEKRKGQYEKEVLKGTEFNINGDLVEKERVIDRTGNFYKEYVAIADTGEVLRDVEERLKEDHQGHGSAKFKK